MKTFLVLLVLIAGICCSSCRSVPDPQAGWLHSQGEIIRSAVEQESRNALQPSAAEWWRAYFEGVAKDPSANPFEITAVIRNVHQERAKNHLPPLPSNVTEGSFTAELIAAFGKGSTNAGNWIVPGVRVLPPYELLGKATFLSLKTRDLRHLVLSREQISWLEAEGLCYVVGPGHQLKQIDYDAALAVAVSETSTVLHVLKAIGWEKEVHQVRVVKRHSILQNSDRRQLPEVSIAEIRIEPGDVILFPPMISDGFR